MTTTILDYRNGSDLEALANVWDRLCERESRFIPNLAELKDGLEHFRLLVAIDNGDVFAMACFVYSNWKKSFCVAERRLFDLPVKIVSLLGSCVLGEAGEDIIAKFLYMIINESHFDLIDLGEIVVDSPLYKVVMRLDGVIASRVHRRNATHWLIKLPNAFEDYCRSLGAGTRRNNKFRRLTRQSAFDVHVVHRADQVQTFLRDGEKISRLSYQWNLGTRLCNDESNRQRLTRLAEVGVLRCYILYLHGDPCAFVCGRLSHKRYLYEAPGYDPKYANQSPGTVLLIWMICDLINNTDCEFFDFGIGGDLNDGYKSRYGNTSLDVVWMQLGLYRPYPLLIIGLDYALNFAKSFVVTIIGYGKLMKWLKKASRRYGDRSISNPSDG